MRFTRDEMPIALATPGVDSFAICFRVGSEFLASSSACCIPRCLSPACGGHGMPRWNQGSHCK